MEEWRVVETYRPRTCEGIGGVTVNNDERFAKCRLAVNDQSKDDFSHYALSLLHQGYLLECGKRGGLSKRWIGHVRDEQEYYQHLRDVYERATATRQER